ncbi:SDH family Clp fold serine proteinase [Comamonas jiangduensis]|uniref:SDH family Clp fold serine proteinase n=1 Tax=Comamonas jiangduensis TaxID=1194168 RepID=UPI003BF8BDE7
MSENTDSQPYKGIVTDVITYAGSVSMTGYETICEQLKNKKGHKALLALATPGGDPHAGFRIARALQHAYGEFDLLVPRYCKSAGTLIAIGAKKLYLDDMSELGPLDIQVKKNDELVGRNSGLDIIAALDYLRDQSMSSFHKHCTELVAGAGLSTKAASGIAAKLTIGMLKPISAQIDPMKLAEMQRAMDIAYQYGNRLNEASGNLRSQGLDLLVSGYPSHGFVIDRKEAKSIFIEVHRPERFMQLLSQALQASMDRYTNSSQPTVTLQSFNLDFSAINNEGSEHAESSENEQAQSDQPDPKLRPNESQNQSDADGEKPDPANDATDSANAGSEE